MHRREFLRAVAVAASSPQALAYSGQAGQGGWPIWASRAGETYYFDARTPEGYRIAQYLLRDIRANRVGFPHPYLLRSLAQIQAWWAQYGRHVCLEITSGLRTYQTNKSTEGAARASLHLPDERGRFFAVDFRPGNVALDVAARWLRAAGVGGIGLYVERGFLHADVGRPRVWVSK